MMMRLFILSAMLVSLAPPRLPAAEQASAPVSPAPAAAEAFAGRDRLDFANGLYARNMFDLAAEEYGKLIHDFPGHPMLSDASFRLGESYFFLNQYEKALASYETYLTTYPGGGQKGMATLRIGESLYQLGRKDEAFEKIRPVLESTDPFLKNAADYYAGRILMEKGDTSGAAEHLGRVVAFADKKNPFRDVAAYHLGKADLEKGLYKEALEVFQQAKDTDNADLKIYAEFGMGQSAFQLKDYKAAAEHFLTAYRTTPDANLKSNAFVNYLTALYEAGDHAAILEKYADEPGLRPADARTALVIAARSAYALKKYKEAAELYTKALSAEDLTPEMKSEIAEGLVESLLGGGMNKEAAEAVDNQKIPADIADERWLYLAGEAMKRAGRHDDALALIDVFLRRFPDSQYKSQVMMNRGYILVDAGRTAEARKAFDDFLAANPKHPYAKQTLMNRITLDISLKDWDSAIQSSKAFLEVFGDSAEAATVLYQLGSVYLTKKDYAQAAKTYEDFSAKYADSEKKAEASFYLAYSLQMQDQFDRAAELYSKVEKGTVPEDIHIAALKNLAYCHIHKDRLDDAAGAYYALISEYPGKPLSPEVYFWLADYFQKKGEGKKLLDVMTELGKLPQAKEKPAETEFFLAEGYRLTKDYDDAITHYNTALAFPNSPKAAVLLGKGISESAAGRHDDAARDLEDAVHEAKDDHSLALDARLYLADAYAAGQRYKEAGKAYFAAAILYENADKIPMALMKAGECFEKAGMKDEAEKAYEEMQSRFPKHELTAKAQEKLSGLKKVAV